MKNIEDWWRFEGKPELFGGKLLEIAGNYWMIQLKKEDEVKGKEMIWRE